MTPKNWIIEGKNRINGGEGWSKMTPKNRTSFSHDPLSTPVYYVYYLLRKLRFFQSKNQTKTKIEGDASNLRLGLKT